MANNGRPLCGTSYEDSLKTQRWPQSTQVGEGASDTLSASLDTVCFRRFTTRRASGGQGGFSPALPDQGPLDPVMVCPRTRCRRTIPQTSRGGNGTARTGGSIGLLSPPPPAPVRSGRRVHFRPPHPPVEIRAIQDEMAEIARGYKLDFFETIFEFVDYEEI